MERPACLIPKKEADHVAIAQRRKASKSGSRLRGPRLFDVLADSEKDRGSWLEARDAGIGASEVATLFGVNPWESPFSLYQKKRGEIAPQPDNERMKWGRKLEHIVGETFAEETGREVWKHPLGAHLLRSRAFPWLLATPDYEQRNPRLATDGLLECKTTGARYEADWSEEAPLYYQIQVQQQLLVTGRLYASIACLIGGQKFIFTHVVRNDKFLKTLLTKTQKFWEMVQAGNPPPIDASEATISTLKKMREDGRVITLPKDVLKWHDQMLRATEHRKAAEADEKEAKQEISALMGTAKRGLLPEGKGIYKFETRAAYNVKAHTVGASRSLKFSNRADV
jgi:putative phage-type endonuclease